MPFDAGAIMAHLDLDEKDFDRKIQAAQARADKFERDPIKLKIGEVFDQQQLAKARRMFTQLDQQISRDAVSRMRSGSGSVLGTLMSVTSPGQVTGAPSAQQAARQGILGRIAGVTSGGGSAGGHVGSWLGGGGGAGRTASGVLGGIGPGILGFGAKTAGILGLGGAALGGLPALAGIGGAAGIAGVGAGFIGLGAQQLIGTKNIKGKPPTQGPLYDAAKQASAAFHDAFKSAAAPLIAPLKQAFSAIPGLMRSITPALRQAFAGAGTLIMPLLRGITDIARMALPLLGKAFRAVSPLVRPLLDGLGMLLRGILPGLIVLIRASAPAIRVFAQILGMLGRDLGTMFRVMAPAIRASSVILKALMGVLGGLFPIIGKLAAVFAQALAPVFIQLAGVIRSLMPTLIIVGHVFASLAGAILKDLVAAFGALAHLLVDISPALRIVAGVLSRVFTVLENSGVFAILGDALEKIVPVLARLINELVRQLAPILPVLVTLLAQFANVMITLLAAGLTTVLTGLLLLIKHFPWLVPLIAAASAAFLAFNLVLSANPIGLVIIAIGALIGAGTLLVKHWGAVWGFIKRVAADAWHFIWDGFGKYLLPLLGPVGLIALGAIELAKHWHTVTGLIKRYAHDLWQWLWSDFGAKILGLFTRTIPGWWDRFTQLSKDRLIKPFRQGLDDLRRWVWNDFGAKIINLFTKTLPARFGDAVRAISRAWNDIKNAVRGPVVWVVDHVINGLISAFDWISGKVGGPHINAVHPMGLRTGGRIPGYGGGDRHLSLLEGGEAVVSKETTAKHARELAWWGVPGFARGGKVGQNPPHGNPHLPHGTPDPGGGIGGFFHKLGDIGKITAAVFSGNTTALTNAITDMIPGAAGHGVADLGKLLVDIPKTLIKDAVKDLIGIGGLGANAGAIVKYAMSFIGRIPYVWGGTAVPGGADCSGFTKGIYEHFGITTPRTSEAQGAWVKRGPPTPGGLAFYHSPAGGADPGHVAIVRNAMTAISQGGGMGPQIMPLHGLPLLWTGTPPGGLGSGGWGVAAKGPLQQFARNLLASFGWGNQWPAFNALEMSEAGWDIHATNPSSGAYGLPQALPPGKMASAGSDWRTSGYTQLRWMMNYIRGNGNFHDPNSAWAFHQANNWYDGGGWLRAGMVSKGPRPEAVLNPGQSAAFLELARAASQGHGIGDMSGIETRLERVIRAIETSAARTGGAMADALNGAARGAAYRSAYSAR